MDKKSKSMFYSLTYIVLTAIIFIFAFMLLRFPEKAGDGIKNGIELCIYTLIPSMYPFMFLASFIVLSGISEKFGSLFSFFTEKMFKLPGVCGSLIILSMVGGLPVGGKMTADFYDRGYITKNQGRRLLLFCINPGPAFVISGVGYYMLGSKTAGFVIFISLLLSSFSVGVLSKIVFEDDIKRIQPEIIKPQIQSAIVSAITESSRNMLNVCSWVVLFSCVMEMITLFSLSENMTVLLCSILEITTGCEKASETMPIPIITGIIGFSGICAHLQIMPSITKLKLPIKYFLCGRIVNASLAVIFSMLIIKIFPISVDAVELGSLPGRINNDISVPVCIGIMVMAILFLLGENYKMINLSIKRK